MSFFKPVENLHTITYSHTSSWVKNRKKNAYRKKTYNNDSQYVSITSPNRSLRIGITENGKIDIWGLNCPIFNSVACYPPMTGAIKKAFCSDTNCAAISESGDLWLWGQFYGWNCFFPSGDNTFTDCWVLEKQQDEIVWVDLCNTHAIATTKSGKVFAIDVWSRRSKYNFLKSFNNVSMTSTAMTKNLNQYGHIMILTKNGYVTCIGNNICNECMVPASLVFEAIEASDCLSTGITRQGNIVMWGDLMRHQHCIDWRIPWRVSEESIMKFIFEYGHFLSMRSIPKSIKRKNDYRSIRMLQRMTQK